MSDNTSLQPASTPRRSRRRLLIGVGALIAVVGGGTAAYAGIPDTSTGVITACYVKAGAAKGAVRVIDAQAGATCAASENTLKWNAAGIRFRGAYSGVTPYAVNDVVTKDGNAYIAKKANTGISPANTVNWGLLVTAGATGAQGQPGPQGPQGPQGPAGPTSAGAFYDLSTFTTASTTYVDVANVSFFSGTSANVVARFAAESDCSSTSWCSVRILVDGVEMAGGSGTGAAFDDANTLGHYEAHSIDRYQAGVSAGTHTITVQAAVIGSSGSFRLDDSTLVVQSLG